MAGSRWEGGPTLLPAVHAELTARYGKSAHLHHQGHVCETAICQPQHEWTKQWAAPGS